MGRFTRRIAKYVFIGAVINVLIAWGLSVCHVGTPFEWRPFHNTRPESPVAIFGVRRVGVAWVMGVGRPGSLIARYPDRVSTYRERVWWPSDAVTFRDADFAVASGWPLLCLSSWRTTRTITLSGDQGLRFQHVYHWGVVLSDETPNGYRQVMPTVLPLRPIWSSFAINSMAYAALMGVVVAGFRSIRRCQRRSRGWCVRCAYPLVGMMVCPECACPNVGGDAGQDDG